MNWKKVLYYENEQPLERFVNGISNTAIFRTVGFVGDSMSSGEFESLSENGTTGYHDYFEYSWGQYMARKNGFKAYNFSRGGMSAKDYVEWFADANRFWSPEMACQAYVIALGANDIFVYNQEIGTSADIDTDKNTMARYYGEIVKRYKEIQPRAKFFFVTMPRSGDDTDELRRKHAELMYDLADYFSNAYVIDLFKYGPVYDEEFKSRFFLYGHMNASGYILTANMVDSYIDYIIRKNPGDFEKVPYIGTDLR